LLKLAHDQHAAGLATAVDVVREQIQLQRDQQTLLVACDNSETSNPESATLPRNASRRACGTFREVGVSPVALPNMMK
jgi:hypothetical protein